MSTKDLFLEYYLPKISSGTFRVLLDRLWLALSYNNSHKYTVHATPTLFRPEYHWKFRRLGGNHQEQSSKQWTASTARCLICIENLGFRMPWRHFIFLVSFGSFTDFCGDARLLAQPSVQSVGESSSEHPKAFPTNTSYPIHHTDLLVSFVTVLGSWVLGLLPVTWTIWMGPIMDPTRHVASKAFSCSWGAWP